MSTTAKLALNSVHDTTIFQRRVDVLTRHLAQVIPPFGSVLDVGCGDGSIAANLMRRRPDLHIEGVDVLVRPTTQIPVTGFDGKTLPYETKAFDFVTLVDVLHHTDDPPAGLAEAARVARRAVIVKDHLVRGPLARPTLRVMDWFGNRGHDVVLPYNYLDEAGWRRALRVAGLRESQRNRRLGLYPAPFGWVFDRSLHFVAVFEPELATAA